MSFPFLRPAKLSDLDQLIAFSKESGVGITSLPQNPAFLERKVHASERSFQEAFIAPAHETYLFCLEQEGQVIGTASIVSRIGMTEPFFAYHLLHEKHSSPYLGIDTKIPVLHFTKARKKPTEIGSLFLSKPHRHHELAKLLSFSRFLFIATFRERFASTVIAELRGVNYNGYSPFWEAVGRAFFQVDFAKADFLRTEHSAVIEELSPKYPIYVDLLPQEAREVIGKTHSETIGAYKLLEKQGFKMSHYLDIFDGGPHIYAPTDEIQAVKMSHEVPILELRTEMESAPLAILSNTHLDFRTTLSPLILENNQAIFPPAAASALQVDLGSPIRYYFL